MRKKKTGALNQPLSSLSPSIRLTQTRRTPPISLTHSPTGRLWVASRSLYFEPAPALGGSSSGLASPGSSSSRTTAPHLPPYPPGTLLRFPLPAVTALRFGEDSDSDDGGPDGEDEAGGRRRRVGSPTPPPRPPPPPTTARCRVWVDEVLTLCPGVPAVRSKGARLLECMLSARGAAKLAPRLGRLRTLAADARLGGRAATAAARAAVSTLVSDQQDAGAARAAGSLFDAPAVRLTPGVSTAGRVAILPPPALRGRRAGGGGGGAAEPTTAAATPAGLVRFLPVGPGLGGGAACAASDVALAIPRSHALEPTGLELVLGPGAVLGDGESPGSLSGGGGGSAAYPGGHSGSAPASPASTPSRRPPLPPSASRTPPSWPAPDDPYGGLLGRPLRANRPPSSSAEGDADLAAGGGPTAPPTPADALPWPAGRAPPLSLTLAFRTPAARTGFLTALAAAGGPRAPWGGPAAAARAAKAWAGLSAEAHEAAGAPPASTAPPSMPPSASSSWPALARAASSRRRRPRTLDPPIRSTFDYLWALNLAAGRSANDLSQFPVFPWVLADFSSPSLDLACPAAFRDLAKPMGALSAARLAAGKARWADLSAAAAALGTGPGGGGGGPPRPPPRPPGAPPSPRSKPEKGATPPPKPTPAATAAASAALAGVGPFMWGSHYSTPGGAAFWLARPRPDLALRLQGGAWDASHRGFHGLASAWASASGGAGDFKELTPEFYARDPGLYLPLSGSNGGGSGGGGGKNNGNHRGSGRRQPSLLANTPPPSAHTPAALPPWAQGSPSALATALAAALEAPTVTRALPRWIDLIFGPAARGKAALVAGNVFHPLTDDSTAVAALVSIGQDAAGRAALLAQAAEFGRTPAALFEKHHPPAGKLKKKKAPGGGGGCLRPAVAPPPPPPVPWATPDMAPAEQPAAAGAATAMKRAGATGRLPLAPGAVPLSRRSGVRPINGPPSSIATAGGSSLFFVSSHALADLDTRSDYGDGGKSVC